MTSTPSTGISPRSCAPIGSTSRSLCCGCNVASNHGPRMRHCFDATDSSVTPAMLMLMLTHWEWIASIPASHKARVGDMDRVFAATRDAVVANQQFINALLATVEGAVRIGAPRPSSPRTTLHSN